MDREREGGRGEKLKGVKKDLQGSLKPEEFHLWLPIC